MAEENTQEVYEMTQEGYNEKVKELNERKNEKRNAISEQIKYAKSLGDFSENAELDAAKEAENENEKAILRLEYEISKAKIIKPQKFIICEKENGEIVDYYICELVGETESDFLNHKISKQSFFAQEIGKHKKNDSFKINEFEFTIIEDDPKKITQENLEKARNK